MASLTCLPVASGQIQHWNRAWESAICRALLEIPVDRPRDLIKAPLHHFAQQQTDGELCVQLHDVSPGE
jgi:hypothetical protein